MLARVFSYRAELHILLRPTHFERVRKGQQRNMPSHLHAVTIFCIKHHVSCKTVLHSALVDIISLIKSQPCHFVTQQAQKIRALLLNCFVVRWDGGSIDCAGAAPCHATSSQLLLTATHCKNNITHKCVYYNSNSAFFNCLL